jgi:hypothetical protein
MMELSPAQTRYSPHYGVRTSVSSLTEDFQAKPIDIATILLDRNVQTRQTQVSASGQHPSLNRNAEHPDASSFASLKRDNAKTGGAVFWQARPPKDSFSTQLTQYDFSDQTVAEESGATAEDARQIATMLRQRKITGAIPAPINVPSPVRRKMPRSRPLWQRVLRSLVRALMQLGQSSSQSTRSTISRQSGKTQTAPVFTVRDGVIMLAGAITLRVVLNLMLMSFPGLWFPVVGIVIAPAAIALYQTRNTPQSGFTWACRLFVIMLGLLLGGRLMV